MKKIKISEKNKNLLIIMLIITTGVYGSIADYYNGENNLFPRIPLFKFLDEKIEKNEPNKPATHTIYTKYNTINSVWFLFIIIGIMLFYIELYNVKSPILLKSAPTLLYYHINIFWIDKKIEYYTYFIRQ